MSKLTTLLCALLGISLITTGIWGYKGHKKNTLLTTNNQSLHTELTTTKARLVEMNQLQEGLQAEVDSLVTAFTAEQERNQHLEQLLALTRRRNAKLQAEVDDRQMLLDQLKANAQQKQQSLMQQLTGLIKIRTQLEGKVQEVAHKNKTLTKKAVALGLDPNKSISENRVIVKEIQKKWLAQQKAKKVKDTVVTAPPIMELRATSFRVEIGGKKDKVTAKAKKAKSIGVSFDLLNIPDDLQVIQNMYLVIVNDSGQMITCAEPINASVPVNGEDTSIQALIHREVQIDKGQRINFIWELEDKIKAGYYRVEIHSNKGFLGEASFRLG